MTDFGTMSVTRSLSISTRNTSTTSGIPHFQSGFGTFYGSMPLKDHDLTSMTYPGFYGNHSGEFFPSQPVNNGLSINSGGTTCHQQQFQQQQQQQQHNQEHHHYHHQQQQQQQQQHQQQQQQQQNKRRGEWITFSKPFLLKLVEKLCQLSFETEVVPSPAPEVSSQGGPVDQKVKTNQSSVNILTGNPSVSPSEATNSESSYSPSISLATTALTTATTTPLVNVQTSNDKININDSSSGVCSRKSRQKSRPVKFVRPFESSEERQKSEDSDINVESDDDDDNDDTTMKKNNNKSSGNSSNTISAVVSPTPVNPSCVAVAANSSSAVAVVVGGKIKENLKRERDACEDSETEHVNVEDDDDDDDDGDTNAPTAKTKTTDHPGSENIHGREGTGKDQSILERSFQSAKLHFNPGSSSAPPPPTHHPHHHLFNPLWSEYFKLNFGLQPTYQPAFNSHKGTQAEPSRQSWAAFNKSLVYKMFDEVLDNDKTHNGVATYQPGAQQTQSALHDARFLFASHRPSHLGLHLSNGLDKHLGTYDVAFCQGRVGQVRDSHDDDRENKRSSVGQVRNKRLRDGFARGRHQLINKRNKVRSSCATKVTCPRNSGLERKEQSERSNCKDANPVCDVPILGALLSSNDTKLYSSNRSLHNSVNNNNSNKNVKVCSEQQHNTILKPTTANNNNNNASPISCDIPLKNGLRQNPSSGKVEGWPKWVALDKGQVKSLVDSLVATMMGTGDGQSPSSCQSMTPPPPPPPKSRDDDSEMQVDGNSNEESSQQHQQQQLQQQQQTATSGDVSVEEDIKESADVDHATSSNSSGTSTYQSPQSSPKSCGIEIERSAPPTHNNNNNNNENSSSSSNRDSETETNFSGDTQLDQSDLDEYSGRQVEEDMSDDGESSARDADTDDCARMECHSTHRRCPIKWKSNMLKRMKAEKRRPET